MTQDELNQFFHMALSSQSSSDVSTSEVFKPDVTEAQKGQIWIELKAQEEMFKKEKDTIFKTYK